MTWLGFLVIGVILLPALIVAIGDHVTVRRLRAYCAEHGCTDVTVRLSKNHYVVSFRRAGRARKARFRGGAWLDGDPAMP